MAADLRSTEADLCVVVSGACNHGFRTEFPLILKEAKKRLLVRVYIDGHWQTFWSLDQNDRRAREWVPSPFQDPARLSVTEYTVVGLGAARTLFLELFCAGSHRTLLETML